MTFARASRGKLDGKSFAEIFPKAEYEIRAGVCISAGLCAISNEIEASKINWQDVCGRGQKSPKVELRGGFGNCTPTTQIRYSGTQDLDMFIEEKRKR